MYEQFPPTDKRDYTLIVCDGLAYRSEMDDSDYDPKAMDILDEATSIITDKCHWIPTEIESCKVNPRYYERILATDNKGNRCSPTASYAERFTLLGALDRASQNHYTPNSQRIAMNAMQRAIQGWISLGYNHDKRRQQEQREDVVGIDDYIDQDMEREGHSRCLSILEDAKQVLAKVRDKQ